MNATSSHKTIRKAALTLCTALLFVIAGTLYAQGTATLSGTVTDPLGNALANATITVTDAARHTQKTKADAQGNFTLSGLAPGKYSLEADAPYFAPAVQPNLLLTDGQSKTLSLTLKVANATEQVDVEAGATGSTAAALAPMDSRLDTMSARTEITQQFITNFTSPVADYGEAVQMAPSTFTTNGNGVGLGQSKTYFRGFPDGDYDIDFDGLPFYDTNTPSHHSWAFFPAQFLGGIDFDRSPGTASTIGPTPFGGSIHLLSKELSPLDNVRGTFSGGSFHTYLYDAAYDSGTFGPGKRFDVSVDVHHLQSDGYQTFNFQTRNAGDIKVGYKINEHTTLTGFSGVIWLDANTPNFNATRCQMYGTGPGCAGTPFANSGINFLNTNNSDPVNYLDYQYNYYHVPTDFEYVGLHTELGHGFQLDIKPYTYNYDNSEKYTNATPITEASTINGSKTYNGMTIAPCNVPVTKKGVTAIPCGVDKYNSYRKYGETSELSQVSRFGIFRAGMWYEWANTNRHQYPSDPLSNWADQTLPNFAEKFVTNSYQPFAEYEFRITPRLTFTPGVKFAYYTIGTQQFADDGKTIGSLAPAGTAANPAAFIANGGSYFATLPSFSANYRLRTNWSVYGQIAQGSIVPPSAVFDYQQGTNGQTIPPATLPKQQKNTTYQAGTVLKAKRFTLDGDYYHIHFDNTYSSTLNPAGEPVFFAQPSSVTQGLEGESNIYLVHGLSIYLNASYDRATYEGSINATCTSSPTVCATAGPLSVNAPGGLFVQQTPSDIETEGLTYQHKGWDAGFFNKRVGTFYIDNGAYHNQATIDPFDTANVFLNYTLRSSGRFNQTRFGVAFNNLFDSHSITGNSLAGSVVPAPALTANGATYTDPFNTAGPTPINAGDNLSVIPARSVMFTVVFGFGHKER